MITQNQLTRYLVVASLAMLTALCVLTKRMIANGRENAQKEKDSQALAQYHAAKIDSLYNANKQLVIAQKVAEVYNADVIKELSVEIFNLKERDEKQIKQVQALIRVVQDLKLDTPILIPYPIHDTVSYNPDSLVRRGDVVVPPQPFQDSTTHYSISGTVLKEGVRINTLSFADTVSIRLAEQKKGFFSSKEQVIQIIHSNPLVTTTGSQSMVLKEKPSAWNRWIKPTLAALAATWLTSKFSK